MKKQNNKGYTTMKIKVRLYALLRLKGGPRQRNRSDDRNEIYFSSENAKHNFCQKINLNTVKFLAYADFKNKEEKEDPEWNGSLIIEIDGNKEAYSIDSPEELQKILKKLLNWVANSKARKAKYMRVPVYRHFE
jgi:hypothetical protein